LPCLKPLVSRRGAAKPILDDFSRFETKSSQRTGEKRIAKKRFKLQSITLSGFNSPKKIKMEVSRSASPKTSGFKDGGLA